MVTAKTPFRLTGLITELDYLYSSLLFFVYYGTLSTIPSFRHLVYATSRLLNLAIKLDKNNITANFPLPHNNNNNNGNNSSSNNNNNKFTF